MSLNKCCNAMSCESCHLNTLKKKKELEYFNTSLDGMRVHRRVTPGIKISGTHLYTWPERAGHSESKVSCARK